METHPCEHEDCPKTWCYRDPENWDYSNPRRVNRGSWVRLTRREGAVTLTTTGTLREEA